MHDRGVEPGAYPEHSLRLRRLGVDTYHEFVIYMNVRCHVCRAEGFQAQARVEVWLDDRHIIATLNVVSTALLRDGEASLSESAWRALAACEGDRIVVTHPPPLESLRWLVGRGTSTPAPQADWREWLLDVDADVLTEFRRWPAGSCLAAANGISPSSAPAWATIRPMPRENQRVKRSRPPRMRRSAGTGTVGV